MRCHGTHSLHFEEVVVGHIPCSGRDEGGARLQRSSHRIVKVSNFSVSILIVQISSSVFETLVVIADYILYMYILFSASSFVDRDGLHIVQVSVFVFSY